jgi:hypothetical protein
MVAIVGAFFDYFGKESPKEVFGGLQLGAEWVRVLRLGDSGVQDSAKRVSDVMAVAAEAFSLPNFFASGKKMGEEAAKVLPRIGTWDYSFEPAQPLIRKVVDFVGNFCDVVDHTHSRLQLIDCSDKLPHIRTLNKACGLYADTADFEKELKSKDKTKNFLRAVKLVVSLAMTTLTAYTLMLGKSVPKMREITLSLGTISFVSNLALHVYQHAFKKTD